MYSIFKTFVLSLLIIAQVHFAYAQNAAILPPAKTTFLDSNGKPLTSGTVDFYIPGTSTRKATWQDGAATILNTNPVVLDGAGRGLILGNGSYREVVKDRVGNIIWDQVTNSAGAGGSSQSTVGDGLSVGSILPWSGLVAPVNYAFPYGQEVSRTTYAALKTAITLIQNITCVSGNATVTSVADTTQLNVGAAVEAACLPASSVIVSKTVNTVTVNNLALVSTTSSATFFPWGAGNGLTTFNVPDLRGVYLPGRNNMGGSSSANLTTSFYTDPNSSGGRGGSQSHTLLISELASHNHTITDPGHVHVEVGSPAGGASNHVFTPTNGTSGVNANTLDSTASATTGITINNTGGGIAVSATVAAGGSGYTAGTQLLTLVGGTCTTQPQFNITTSAGAITAPVLVTAGDCSIVPSNPVSTTGGGGTLGTLNVTWSARPIGIIPPSKTINYIIKITPDISLSIANCANLTNAGTACTANTGTSGHNVPYLDGNNTWSGTNGFQTVTITGGSITGMPLPTLGSDVASKQYVDNVATGLNVLAQTKYATAAVLPNTPTYANGASGVGATLTAGSNTTLTVDGNVVAINEVVLVKNQASAFQNGVYTLTTVGSGAAAWVLTRATYFDQAAEMKAGSYTFVTNGATNASTSYVLQTAVTTVGTDPLNWVLFASSVAGVSQLDGVQGAITVQAGSFKVVGSQLSSNVLSSRAFAATQNLSSFSSIKTLGYATAGDGGGATFKNVSTTPFQDSYVTTGSITNAGSGCTNGTYFAFNLTGGTGVGLAANITVAGNVVTAVTIVKGGGNGYTVGDTVTNTGVGCSNWVWTVSAVSTPQASFTDTAGNHWQYVPSPLTSIYQFGAKGDWNGVDATATNDFTAIDAAIKFANRITSGARIDQGGKGGNFVYLANQPSLVCGALVVHGSVKLVGFGPFNSSLKICDSGLSASSHFITLGDPNIQSACFGPGIKDVTLYANTTPPANNQTAMIFSNCAQQTTIIERVAVYSGLRSCFRYTNGYGGAAKITALDFFCTMFTGTSNDGISLDPTTTINMEFLSLIVEAGGAGVTGNAVNWSSGNLFIWGYHTEGVTTGLNVNVPTATYQGSIHGGTGGNGCTELIKLAVTNTLGNIVVGTSQKNGCTRLVTNGQPAGSNQTTDQVLDKAFNP